MPTPVIGSPPLGKRVAVITSTPPWRPGLGPPREQGLLNAVALQVPVLFAVILLRVPGALGG